MIADRWMLRGGRGELLRLIVAYWFANAPEAKA